MEFLKFRTIFAISDNFWGIFSISSRFSWNLESILGVSLRFDDTFWIFQPFSESFFGIRWNFLKFWTNFGRFLRFLTIFEEFLLDSPEILSRFWAILPKFDGISQILDKFLRFLSNFEELFEILLKFEVNSGRFLEIRWQFLDFSSFSLAIRWYFRVNLPIHFGNSAGADDNCQRHSCDFDRFLMTCRDKRFPRDSRGIPATISSDAACKCSVVN